MQHYFGVFRLYFLFDEKGVLSDEMPQIYSLLADFQK